MTLRSKGEQKAYLDGYEMCAECIEEYLSSEGKKKLECLLIGVRNAVEIEDISETKEELDKTQMVDKSNFDNKQYKADLQGAYDCGYEQAKKDMFDYAEASIRAEERMMNKPNDMNTEEYHKGMMTAFYCVKLKSI